VNCSLHSVTGRLPSVGHVTYLERSAACSIAVLRGSELRPIHVLTHSLTHTLKVTKI